MRSPEVHRLSYAVLALIVMLTLFTLLVTALWFRLAAVHRQVPNPEGILVLGGDLTRERQAAQMARTLPQLPVWVSTGVSNTLSRRVFQAANVPLTQVHLDRRAVDTVTNFTSLVSEFQQQGVRHLYLVTSDYHMRRSQAIAFFVLGSRGIAFTSVSVPSEQPPESLLRIGRDVGRAVFWLATGHTGAGLHNTPLDL